MFKKTVLKNGLRIITFPMKNTKVVTLLILVATGSKYEKKDVNGISHLVEHMFFKGTKKRPHTIDVVRELDKVGGLYNAFTSKELMGFWVKLDANHFDLAADILSDMIFNSQFKRKEIEKEKRVIIEEINMMQDAPQKYILDLWEKLLYGNQPAGWLISGNSRTVHNISRKDILNYFRNQFSSTNIVVSVAGNLKHKQILTKINNFFGKFKKKKVGLKNPTREFQKSPKILLNFKKTDQTHLCLGVRAFDLFDPRRYALAVASVILGGIMSSRLFIKVREKKGLAYYIKTSSQHYTDTGYLVTHTGVDNQRVEDAIKTMLKEYRILKRKKISKSELTKAKENIKGHLYLNLETSDAWAGFFGGKEIFKEEITTPEQEARRIDKVTQNDILELANEIFQAEKLNLALIGPFKNKEKFQKLLKI